jgi:hypothetical protein
MPHSGHLIVSVLITIANPNRLSGEPEQSRSNQRFSHLFKPANALQIAKTVVRIAHTRKRPAESDIPPVVATAFLARLSNGPAFAFRTDICLLASASAKADHDSPSRDRHGAAIRLPIGLQVRRPETNVRRPRWRTYPVISFS